MAAKGFGVLNFDFTDLGESEGDFADTNFSGTVDDLICAADFFKNYPAPAVIIGHSLGDAASLLAASQFDEIKAVATIDSDIGAYLGAQEKFITRIKAGNHQVIADVPESVGGTDYGATLYELVAEVLADCTALTLRIYAETQTVELARSVRSSLALEKTSRRLYALRIAEQQN